MLYEVITVPGVNRIGGLALLYLGFQEVLLDHAGLGHVPGPDLGNSGKHLVEPHDAEKARNNFV